MPTALLSATVVGPELALADAYATAAFAMGAAGAGWLARLPGYDGCVITSDDRVIWTARSRRLTLCDPGGSPCLRSAPGLGLS